MGIGIPRIVEINKEQGEVKLIVKDTIVYGKIFFCGKQDLDKLVSICNKVLEEENGNSVCTVLPKTLLPPLNVFITALIYYLNIMSKEDVKKRIKRRPLIMLSIMFAKKQLSDIIKLIMDQKNRPLYVLFVYSNTSKTRSIVGSVCMETPWPTDTDYTLLRTVYGINQELTDNLVLEKLIITKISEFVTKMYY